MSTGDKGRPFRVTDRRRFSRDGEPLPQSRESGCEESAATAEKHTKRTHRREDEPEFLEDRLYEADSEQARSLLSLCGKAGGRAVAFGEKVFEAGRERLKNHPLKLDDIRGFVLGFHAKGLDQLIAIKGLAKMGSLGPAIGQCRVFFEAFLSIGYILKEDTEKRIRAYQKYCLRRSIKSIREIIKKGDTSKSTSDLLKRLHEQAGAETRPVTSWAGKDLARIADDLGVLHFYNTFYRQATSITHSNDILGYNPI